MIMFLEVFPAKQKYFIILKTYFNLLKHYSKIQKSNTSFESLLTRHMIKSRH